MSQVWEWSGYSAHGRQSGRTLVESRDDLLAANPGLLVTRLRRLRPVRVRLPAADKLAQLTRLMATMTASGMGFAEILEQLLSQAGSAAERDLLAAVATDLRAGHGLYRAFERRKVFDPMYLSVLRACEEGGDPAELFGLLAETLEKNGQFARSLVSATVYPAILLLSGLGAAWLMAVLVVPSMRSVLGADMELPALTQLLFAVSDAVIGWRPGYGSLALLAAVLLFRRRLRSAVRTLAEWLPLVREMHLARCAAVLRVLLRGQVPLTDALAIASVGCNRRLAAALKRALQAVESGAELSLVFATEPALPPLWGRLVSSGEAGGDYGAAFLMLSRLHERALQRQMAMVSRIAEPCLVLLTGALLTAVLLGLYLPVLQAGTAF